MSSKGIPLKPSAKRINKLPLILFLSVLILVVIVCFSVVNQRQKRLQSNAVDQEAIKTLPINNNTPAPKYLTEDYAKQVEAEHKFKKLKNENEIVQTPDLNTVPQKTNAAATLVPKNSATPPERPLQASQRPMPQTLPNYQESAPQMQPIKSEAQLFREKVANQKRELALKAMLAPSTVNVSRAAPDTLSALPQKGSFPPGTNNPQYFPQSGGVLPTQEKSDQAQKKDFLTDANEDKVSLVNAYHVAKSPFELKQGHLIPMTLITKINSDLPGRIKAQVTENVYDTATGNHLLIPQGTMINGIYDSRVVFGQKRVLVAWQRLIFPDGSSLNVGSMPGTDQEGTAGVSDLVDNHYFQVFGSALLMSVINAGFSIATQTDETASDKETASDSLAKAAAQQMQQTFARIIDKIMSIQPELVIRSGKQGHIILTKDVIGLKPYNPAQKPTYFLKTVEVN